MKAAVIGLGFLIDIPHVRGISQIVYLCIFAGVGGVTYLLVSLLTGSAQMALGDKFFNKIKAKLHIKK